MAEEPYRQALELKKSIVKQTGPVPAYRRDPAGGYCGLARVLSATDRPKEAESNWRAALEILQQLAVEAPQDPEIQDGLGSTLTLLAGLHNQRREFDAAAALPDEARSHLQAALKRRPQHHDFRENYRDYLVVLGQSRLGLADHVRLAATADELAHFGYEPAKDSYAAAGMLGRCTMLADKVAKLDVAKRKELGQRYADQALALLRQAVERGFKDAVQIKKIPTWNRCERGKSSRSCSRIWVAKTKP